ncbi:MAG: hypothetical protein ACOCQD_02745 [archaeon]
MRKEINFQKAEPKIVTGEEGEYNIYLFDENQTVFLNSYPDLKDAQRFEDRVKSALEIIKKQIG